MEKPATHIIGLRREQFSKWERRVALTPRNCKYLLQSIPNLKIKIQPSNTRVFPNHKYAKYGVEVTEDLSDCDLILGIKQVPIDFLIPNKTFMFFSHTIKAQPGNMPLLDALLEKKIRLIDYEKIANEKGERLVAFGKYAGFVGAVDIFYGLGPFLLNRGLATPFLHIAQCFHYFNKDEARHAIRLTTSQIEDNGLPLELCPFIVGVTGYGRCSTGSMEVLKLFPHEEVTPEELPQLLERATKSPESYRYCIYVVTFAQHHMVQLESDPHKPFDKKHYYDHPELYTSIFEDKYLKYLTVLINGIYWEPKYPRLITSKKIGEMARKKELRLIAISDVTCDFTGSIEFLRRFTSIDFPFFVYNPENDSITDDTHTSQTGILYCSVEIMPSELPFDAAEEFGRCLTPFIHNILNSKKDLPLEEQGLIPEIKNAVITLNGHLTDKFTYIEKLRKQQQEAKISLTEIEPILNAENCNRLELRGHLLDKQVINKLCDILVDDLKISVSINKWDLGHGQSQESGCELFIESCQKLDDAWPRIQTLLNENNVKFKLVKRK